MDPFFQIVADRLDDDGLGDVASGIVILIISSSLLNLEWNIHNVIIFILLTVSGLLILTSLTMIPACVAFWTTKSRSLIWTVFHFSKFSEFPLEVYALPIVFMISVILPFAFVNYYPAQIFLGKGMYIEFAWLTPIVGVLSFTVAYSFWKLGLKHYTSTGS